jgi:hypothetical protein
MGHDKGAGGDGDDCHTIPYFYRPEFVEALIAEVEALLQQNTELREERDQARAVSRSHANLKLEALQMVETFKGLTDDQKRELQDTADRMRARNDANGH